MSESHTADPARQIADALTQLRWRRGQRFTAAAGDHRGNPDHDRPRTGGPALGRLISALSAAGSPMSVNDIAERVGVDQPRASRLVAQGVEHGLLRRDADPSDARRSHIALTEQGSETLERVRRQRREALDAALTDFTPDEQQQLAGLLTRLAENWQRDR